MDDLTSPQGALALAISALLLVLGYRLARPERPREWVAIVAYAAALAAQLLGARGLLPGRVFIASAGLRIAGAALLVVGLVVAGSASRARLRPAIDVRPNPVRNARAPDPTYAGLALVLVGQLARAPSVAGTAVVLMAAALATIVAMKSGASAR